MYLTTYHVLIKVIWAIGDICVIIAYKYLYTKLITCTRNNDLFYFYFIF